jgi:hypothetical protein
VRRVVLAAAVAVLLGGCGGDEDESAGASTAEALGGCDESGTFTVAPDEVAPGETIALSVENPSSFPRDITYGLGGRVDRATEDGWADASAELATTAVPEIAIVLRPGETSSVTQGATADVIELAPDAEPGDYRVIKETTAGGNTESHCAVFSVTG